MAALDARIKLGEDTVNFYKAVNTELEKKRQAEEANASAPKTDKSYKEDLGSQPPLDSPNKIRSAILTSIDTRVKNNMPTASMAIINPLQSDFDLGEILSELIRMYHENVVTWSNAPAFPEHWMELKLKSALT